MKQNDERVLASKIESEIARFKALREEEIYFALSTDHVNRIKKETFDRVLGSLPDSERSSAERDISKKIGIYGPISAILPYVRDNATKQELTLVGQLRASDEDGEMLVTRILGQLKDLLCDDWNYCEKRKEIKDDWRFLATAVAIAVKTLSLEVGMVAGALLVAIYKGPDFFCNCGERTAQDKKQA